MKPICSAVLAAIAALLLASAPAAAAEREPSDPGSFKQLGHEPLKNRGMNAALAVHGDFAYVGSRTDAHDGTPHGGIMVVDISKKHKPSLVAGPLDAHPGESSREFRVWKSQDVLIVLNTNCGVGPRLHHCTQPSISNFRFYDIRGENAGSPKLLRQFDADTHEFFLWQDPKNPDRALIFGGGGGSECRPRGGVERSCPFSVWDISGLRDGGEIETLYSDKHGYTEAPAPADKPAGGLHSLTVSNDGSRAYFALLRGGFAVVDVSDFAEGRPSPHPRPITANENRPTWAGPGSHSAAKLWGRDWAWASDEVYGSANRGGGCPWGWARLIDIADPTAPRVEGEYKIAQNEASACDKWEPRPHTSYSAHNPTLTPNIVFSTWHSGGLQAVDIGDPTRPTRLAQFMPEPLDEVLLEDPRLSSDPDTGNGEKVVMWSFPIIQDGLMYVVDLRNGLYVLKYRGRFHEEVKDIEFLEGNSNQGDALCFEPVEGAPSIC